MPAKRRVAVFSVPFNGDLALLDEALSSGRVAEVYFSGPSGRDVSTYFSAGEIRGFDLRALRAAISLCRRRKARTNLLCNSVTLFFTKLKPLLKFVRSVKGLDAVTVADPLAVGRFVEEFPDKDIQPSIIMNLDSYAKVEQVLRLGAGTVTLGPRYNRDIRGLKRLVSLKKAYPRFKIKLLANYDCSYDCIYATWHYMAGVFKSQVPDSERLLRESEIYRVQGCYWCYPESEDLIRCPFIRPEDVRYYLREGGADVVKLVHRNAKSETLRKAYRAYFEERWDGDLFELVFAEGKYDREEHDSRRVCDNARFPRGFARKVSTCRKECRLCRYCTDTARKTIRTLPPPAREDR